MSMNTVVLGNTVLQWVVAAAIFGLVWYALALLKTGVVMRLKRVAQKTKTDWDDFVIAMLAGTKKWVIVIISLFCASLVIGMPERMSDACRAIAILALLTQAGMWGNSVLVFWHKRTRESCLESDPSRVTAVNLAGFFGRVLLYSVLVLLFLDNLDVDVTALVASFGIGGIAIALALQNVLTDLFACLAISMDKPFVVGDFIIVGDLTGTVENIGLKTTRLRSISGEQLVVGNSDLLSSRIHNYKQMAERRIVFSFGILYQTPLDTVKKVPDVVKAIVETQEKARFDRAHFKSFGDSSLDFEVVYFMTEPDYELYMDTQEAINFEMIQKFEAMDVEFAYPTQTLFVTQVAE